MKPSEYADSRVMYENGKKIQGFSCIADIKSALGDGRCSYLILSKRNNSLDYAVSNAILLRFKRRFKI